MDTVITALSRAGTVCGSAHYPGAGQTGRGLSRRNRPRPAGPDRAGGRRNPQTGAGGAVVQPQPRQAAVDSRFRLGIRKIPAGHGPAGVDGGVADGAALEPDRAVYDSPLAVGTQSFIRPNYGAMTQPPLRIGTAGWSVP